MTTQPTPPSRLVSLDIFRGLTVMVMIFVNNGAGEQIFSTLQHSKWNGMTPCDLVFPFFLFIMGISTYLSLRKTDFRWSRKVAIKVAKRTLWLFLIGVAINWFDMACDGRPFDWAHLRIMGVMQRLGLCYGATAILAMFFARHTSPFKGLLVVAMSLLAAYSTLILLGGGYDYDASTNILARADRWLLGPDHLYHKSPVDPEGLLSTLSAIAHTLLGFLSACWAFENTGEGRTGPHRVMSRFLLCGTVLVWVGYLLTFAMPLNKRIWSPSYVLVTCGLAALTQGALIYWLDLRQRAGRVQGTISTTSLIFGTNPLWLYIVSEALSIIFGATGIKTGTYEAIHTLVTNGYWASVAYATLFVTLHALIGYPLWKRHIYIKL